MKIDRPFNQLSKQEYVHFIQNHKQYSDFNTLGLYRSLTENEQLSLAEKIEIRNFANTYFQKTFDFLQLKDPVTYFEVFTLGEGLTRGDKLNYWRIIRENQEKILKDKKIKHRSFGTYSKHNCGYDDCPYNGIMLQQGSYLYDRCMYFKNDENKPEKRAKSQRLKKEQKNFRQNSKNYDHP